MNDLLTDLRIVQAFFEQQYVSAEINGKHAVLECDYGNASRLMGEAQAYEFAALKIKALADQREANPTGQGMTHGQERKV